MNLHSYKGNYGIVNAEKWASTPWKRDMKDVSWQFLTLTCLHKTWSSWIIFFYNKLKANLFNHLNIHLKSPKINKDEQLQTKECRNRLSLSVSNKPLVIIWRIKIQKNSINVVNRILNYKLIRYCLHMLLRVGFTWKKMDSMSRTGEVRAFILAQ